MLLKSLIKTKTAVFLPIILTYRKVLTCRLSVVCPVVLDSNDLAPLRLMLPRKQTSCTTKKILLADNKPDKVLQLRSFPMRCWYNTITVCTTCVSQCSVSPLTSRQASWLVQSVCCRGATRGRIVGQWGCHSIPSEEKREGGDLALGHLHPSCSPSVALWQVSSYREPAGQIDNSMSRPAPVFTSPISRLQALYDTF